MKNNKVIMTESRLYELIENTVINVLKEAYENNEINEGARTDFIKGAFNHAYNDDSEPRDDEGKEPVSLGKFIKGKPNKFKHDHAMVSRDIPGKREHYTNVAGMTEPGIKGNLTRAAAAGATFAGALGNHFKNKISKPQEVPSSETVSNEPKNYGRIVSVETPYPDYDPEGYKMWKKRQEEGRLKESTIKNAVSKSIKELVESKALKEGQARDWKKATKENFKDNSSDDWKELNDYIKSDEYKDEKKNFIKHGDATFPERKYYSPSDGGGIDRKEQSDNPKKINKGPLGRLSRRMAVNSTERNIKRNSK